VGYIRDVLVEAIGPEMGAAGCVDQLRVDAHAALVALRRAFEHVSYAKLLADLLGVDVLPLECESRVAGDHEIAGSFAPRREANGRDGSVGVA
jgi:hypothetical protein